MGPLKVTIVCSDPCEGWPCFECEMVVEAVCAALEGAIENGKVNFSHVSVSQASGRWREVEFSDVDTPYLMVGSEVKLHGRAWRAASFESLRLVFAPHQLNGHSKL